jgi:hypothetical protein
MKVTVKDCLELPVFKNAYLAAGREGLENRVSAVSFLEAGNSGSMKAICIRKMNSFFLPLFRSCLTRKHSFG